MAARQHFRSGSLAETLKLVGGELIRNPLVAAYASRLVSRIVRTGRRLREGDAEELLHDLRLAARRHPVLFIAGGLALGAVIARIAKAGAVHAASDRGPLAIPNFTTVASFERRGRTLED